MTKIFIKGMHCVSCEMLLKHDFDKISGVKVADISHKKGFVEFSEFDKSKRKQIEEVVTSRGYQVVEQHETKSSGHKNTPADYLEIALVVVLFAILAWILEKLKIYQYFPQVGDEASVAIAFLLGLVASISTCLALVGGIVVSFGSTYKIAPDHKHPVFAHMKPHLFFHLSRFLTFVVLGGLLGVVGSFFNFSFGFTSYLTFFVAVVMLYIGLHILNIVPSITKLGFHMPRSFSSGLGALQGAEHSTAPFALGALTFFLPCGFTQSVQIAAIASGGFWAGASLLGAFALGTLPVLLGIGVGSSYAKDIKANLFKKFIGVLIVLFALYSFNNGLRLFGVSFELPSADVGETEIVLSDDGYQEIHMTANWGFDPNNFVIQKDIPVRWIIDGQNVSGCISEIVIPDLGLEFSLEKGENIIEFTPTEVGDMSFSCWMGMVGGSFTVVD